MKLPLLPLKLIFEWYFYCLIFNEITQYSIYIIHILTTYNHT